jgi:hypothetical protein
MYPGADSAAHLRSLTGETFFETRFAQTVEALPGELFGRTLLRLTTTPEMVHSPVLDRLAVRYFVTPQWAPVFGPTTVASGDGLPLPLPPGASVRAPLRSTGPLRAVGISPTASPAGRSGRVEVSVRDGADREVAHGERIFRATAPDGPFFVPIAGEQLKANAKLSVVVTLHATKALQLQAAGGVPALSTVGGAADGLSLVYSGDAVIWQRLTALPASLGWLGRRGSRSPASVLLAAGMPNRTR